MVNTMGWNERSDPDMRTANFCDVYREGVYGFLCEASSWLIAVTCSISRRLHETAESASWFVNSTHFKLSMDFFVRQVAGSLL